jgi:hypothetical protein
MKRLVCWVVVALTACVGPARTDSSYEGKAVETAKTVVSAVETARLAARAAARGQATGQYLSIVLGEAEDEAGAAASAFDSIQPPSKRSENLHGRLSEVVTAAIDVLRELRIAARRSQIAALQPIAEKLAGPAASLHRFVESRE